MTTSQTIRRERARDWPIFDGRELPNDIDVLTVQLRRRSMESIELVVAQASEMLRLALANSTSPGNSFWLAAWGNPVDPRNKVGAYLARRDGLWAAVEKTGIVLPEGPRNEAEVNYDDGSFGFGGSINFALNEIPVALELTRRKNAICLATEDVITDPIGNSKVASFSSADYRLPILIRAAAGEFGEWVFLARSFGKFDDSTVGAEIFAKSEFIDGVEPRV